MVKGNGWQQYLTCRSIRAHECVRTLRSRLVSCAGHLHVRHQIPRMHAVTPVACAVPLSSGLRPHLVDAAYFWDSYRAPLRAPAPSVVELFFSIFGHHPGWIKAALLMRNRVAKLLGLAVPHDVDVLKASRQASYAVGDTIGPWPIYSITEHELIAGRDNRHLDFRVSIFRELTDGIPSVSVSTVCLVHNWFGKVYLFFVVPFHRWGVRYILRNALRAGRL